MSTKQILQSVSIIIIARAACRLTGFLREAVIAAFLGIGYEADAYFMAQTIPFAFFSIIEASLALVILPMYIHFSITSKENEADQFASNVLNIIFISSIVVSALSIFVTPFIINPIFYQLDSEMLQLITHLSRIFFGALAFISLSNIITGILLSKERFLIPSLINIPSNIAVIISAIYFFQKYGVFALAYATVIGGFFQVLIQIPTFRKVFKHKYIFNLKKFEFRKFSTLLLPVVMGTAFFELNMLICRILASKLEIGSVSAISYSLVIVHFVTNIVILAIATVIYPTLSTLSVNRSYRKFKNLLSKTIALVGAITVPSTLGIILLRKEIIKVVFARGAFDISAINLTSYMLGFHVIGMTFYAINEMLIRAFYSLKDMKTPNTIIVLCTILNIMLSFLLVGNFGLGGIGLSISISAFVSCCLLYFMLNKRLGQINYKGSLIDWVKIIVASLMMGIIVYFLKNTLPVLALYPKLVITIFTAILSYFLALYLLKFKWFSLLYFPKKDDISTSC